MRRPKREMAAAQLEREERLKAMIEAEHVEIFQEMAERIQNMVRGVHGRQKAFAFREQMRQTVERARAAVRVQQAMRGALGRRFVRQLLSLETKNLLLGESATIAQRVARGFAGRCTARARRCELAARFVQRTYRGFRGRMTALMERARLEELRNRAEAAARIQSAWRAKVVREEFYALRVRIVAAEEIQRCYRGHIGRRRTKRRRDWENAQPGPERLRLGLRLIEESKVAFERQREEIDLLHRAQEKAESRVSHINAELRESEKELGALERELQEIDEIERDLRELTHEREVLRQGIVGAAGFSSTGELKDDGASPPDILEAMASTSEVDDEATSLATSTSHRRRPTTTVGGVKTSTARKLRADSHALEIAIHRKRAERERKRQELETEFAAVFQEVSRKKHALERLEVSIADMDATRVRKDREFQRLQRNLMELLQEQKYELDALREKGIELETATATSAAAATATALRAKEHEARAATMFSQTEELMKFQFMSMSLSYFSSLNMLQQLREMNADTTTAAVASSADAAAAAAAAATAANVPSIKHMKLGAEDVMAATVKKKQAELDAARAAERDAERSKAEPFPAEMRLWSVYDVGRWLDTLTLGQYKAAFAEASVDGEFLLELREEDLVQVLGMEHKLHVRKVVLARDRLKPLSEADVVKRAVVLREEAATAEREAAQVPTVDAVFSQARNGRLRRLEESLNLGFPVDKEDEKGNTLLCIAAQNVNIKMVELLLHRSADINHRNASGNTPLHFAMAYDQEGTLAEYLIQHGADDTLENEMGCTCYDGIGINKG
ncbi:hypothetical protein CTAYLR_001433 [Chrysophaeum taylorii]|uniref:SAM domain-containing protein n=1 Tax=Chrysophaeum taylorii TaxID=2483200 RepID=A0AAD7XGF1_9STRA|nr:hypothetical protein CTAYLR_001433 [Chrysophaeum taylorii]